MHRVKLEQIGDQVAIALPATLLEEFGLSLGDEMELVTSEAGVTLKPVDSSHMRAVRMARGFMDRYPDAMRELSTGAGKVTPPGSSDEPQK
jgi:hypothetical protein